jgi:hypothetical protein
VGIELRRYGPKWRVIRVEIRSEHQQQTVELRHLTAGTYDEAVELAKSHALEMVGFPSACRLEDVIWEIRPPPPEKP